MFALSLAPRTNILQQQTNQLIPLGDLTCVRLGRAQANGRVRKLRLRPAPFGRDWRGARNAHRMSGREGVTWRTSRALRALNGGHRVRQRGLLEHVGTWSFSGVLSGERLKYGEHIMYFNYRTKHGTVMRSSASATTTFLTTLAGVGSCGECVPIALVAKSLLQPPCFTTISSEWKWKLEKYHPPTSDPPNSLSLSLPLSLLYPVMCTQKTAH